jgi:hypothetical protein
MTIMAGDPVLDGSLNKLEMFRMWLWWQCLASTNNEEEAEKMEFEQNFKLLPYVKPRLHV